VIPLRELGTRREWLVDLAGIGLTAAALWLLGVLL
jgi:hypothetical protein